MRTSVVPRRGDCTTNLILPPGGEAKKTNMGFDRKGKLEFSSPSHRRNVNLAKGETYYAFVLGVRYNRTNYLDYKALFDYGLYMPRDNPLGTFTINTAGLKRLVAGDYNQAMDGRARWKELKNVFGAATLLAKPKAAATPVRAPLRKGSIKSDGGPNRTQERAPRHQRRSTLPVSALQAVTAATSRDERQQRSSKDSLDVRDPREPPDDRSEQSSRAGYPNIDVVLRGKTLMSSHDTLPCKFTLPPLEWVRKEDCGMWVKEPREKDGTGRDGKDSDTRPPLVRKDAQAELLPGNNMYQGLWGSSGDKTEE